jgi:hypothetical protein
MRRRWRGNSIFGPGQRIALDRERRAQWKAKLLLQRRPGGLTLATVEVGRVLLGLLGPDGRLDPCIDRLAALARVHASSVVRALAALREAGFLDWTRRLVRDAATGWRCEQTSNAYILLVPACDTQDGGAASLLSERKTAREVEVAALPEHSSALTALAEIAARRMKVLSVTMMR